MAEERITLYHGSIYDFDKVDVTKGKPNKDFGRGFYTSWQEQHAIDLAVRNCQIEMARQARVHPGSGNKKIIAWLYVFEANWGSLSELNVKEFSKADFEWVDFIVENRSSPGLQHNYDVVIGPTANDDTLITISALLNHTYGDPKSDRAKEIFLEFILADRLPRQTYFATNRAAALLTLKDRRAVR